MILTGIIFLCIAFVADVAFVIHYSFISAWWKGPIGRTLVIMSICLAALYGWSLAVRFFPSIPGKMYLALAIFIVLSLVTVWRYIVLVVVARNVRILRDELDRLHEQVKEGDS